MKSNHQRLIDGHAHLDEVADIEKAVNAALAAGVTQIVGVGMELASNRRILELARQYSEIIYPAVGYHPWTVVPRNIEENLLFVDTHLERCIALGEVGLDYKIKVKKSIQWEVFAEVLQLALKHQKPVIVHSRFSHKRCHQMVAAANVSQAVFHWYSGPGDILERIISDGYYVSCTPALAYSPPHRKAMEQAPLDRILIETDCPVKYQGKNSQPADLIQTLQHLSRIKQMPEKEVAEVVTENAERVFGLMTRKSAKLPKIRNA
jgi:TatD DNase family protein